MSDSPDDFDEFFRTDLPQLIRFLVRSGWGWEDARDAAAEAMLSAYQGWIEIDHPRAYVRKAACRVAAQQRRRDHERLQRSIRGGMTTPEHDDPYAMFDARMDATRRLVALLKLLPDKQRTVLVWHLDGFGNSEIACHLNMSPATVASHLRHAKQSVRRLLSSPERLPTEMIYEGGAPS
ncbi:RNA polymerase sigma factor [Lentzea sp. CA-135723]|uniref:RNA polymerase sigma factor n=1 Tax=Lentzea sp. CA-135723 TaxID=3239950 RepID=UPI003D9210E6